MICSNCGQRIADESFFCPHCGQTTKEGTSIQKCPSCASVVKGTDIFCNICGYRLKGQPPADLAASTQAPALQNRPTLCRVCGKPLNLNSEFCSSCGAPVKTEQPLQAYPQPCSPQETSETPYGIFAAGWHVLKTSLRPGAFSGRVSLYEFWSFNVSWQLWTGAASFIMGLLFARVFRPSTRETLEFLCVSSHISLIITLILTLPAAVRRLHDRNHPWFYGLIPIYNIIVWCFLPGTKGPNEYGPSPAEHKKTSQSILVGLVIALVFIQGCFSGWW